MKNGELLPRMDDSDKARQGSGEASFRPSLSLFLVLSFRSSRPTVPTLYLQGRASLLSSGFYWGDPNSYLLIFPPLVRLLLSALKPPLCNCRGEPPSSPQVLQGGSQFLPTLLPLISSHFPLHILEQSDSFIGIRLARTGLAWKVARLDAIVALVVGSTQVWSEQASGSVKQSISQFSKPDQTGQSYPIYRIPVINPVQFKAMHQIVIQNPRFWRNVVYRFTQTPPFNVGRYGNNLALVHRPILVEYRGKKDSTSSFGSDVGLKFLC